ncbi:bifunctional Cyclin-dependent kinase [Babesia duncani]|uniref:Cyclin-dependent kinases regulatory subunit n=1 Tax=Babesia duncani TaxID=323732 RepID=A0AAD9PID3_9APIC|nr:bifunctional Cyclin-dependent kinase [Babesia duncani]
MDKQVSEQLQECLNDACINGNVMFSEKLANLKNTLCNDNEKQWLKLWGIDVKNPFTKYGTLPPQAETKLRRKTNSAPLFATLDIDSVSVSLGNQNTDVNTDLENNTSISTISDNVKSTRDSLDCFSSVRILQRLYTCTKNPYFCSRENAELEREKWDKPSEIGDEFVMQAILAGGESHLCSDLFYDLEYIANKTFLPSQSYQKPKSKFPRLVHSPTIVTSRFSSQLSEEDKLVFKVSTESAKAAMRKVGLVSSSLNKPYDMNDDFMLTDAEDYAILTTKYGRVIYSPKMQDDKYMYRFVILTKDAQEAVEALANIQPKQQRTNKMQKTANKRLLSEYEIIRELGIQMSPGWQHFMYFKNQQREIILRRPL